MVKLMYESIISSKSVIYNGKKASKPSKKKGVPANAGRAFAV